MGRQRSQRRARQSQGAGRGSVRLGGHRSGQLRPRRCMALALLGRTRAPHPRMLGSFCAIVSVMKVNRDRAAGGWQNATSLVPHVHLPSSAVIISSVRHVETIMRF